MTLPDFASGDYIDLVSRVAARVSPADVPEHVGRQTVVDVLEALRVDEIWVCDD